MRNVYTNKEKRWNTPERHENVDLNKWKASHIYLVGCLSITKISVLSRLFYKFNAIPKECQEIACFFNYKSSY